MNGPWASLLRVWVLNSFCFAIPSKVTTARVLHHTRRALCLTCHPNRHSKVRYAVVCNRCIRKLTLLDSINVDTAAAEYASTSGSIKRVGRRICFHQACTPGVCETFLVVLELRFTSGRLYLRYIYLEYCILLFVTRRPRPRYLSWLLLLVLSIGNQGIGGAHEARPLVRTPGVPVTPPMLGRCRTRVIVSLSFHWVGCKPTVSFLFHSAELSYRYAMTQAHEVQYHINPLSVLRVALTE